jgi:DNA-binding CsgD family transcriptional regulator
MAGPIVGREAELATIGETLAGNPNGLQVLLIDGEPGIGKTTLWQEGVDQADRLGFRILSCRAAQAETRMSFAGLGDLFARVESDALAALPPPQRVAIDRALLRAEAGPKPSPPHAIGAGVVAVISALTKHGPVLVAIDDIQWLDAPTIRSLGFALRRLEGHPVTVLATERTGDQPGWSESFDRLASERVRRLRLGPLSLGALYEVLSPRLGRALTRPLLGSIESVSRGNPFYALELARAMDDGRSGAGVGLAVPVDTSELLARRLRRLPRRTRDELLRASALAQPTTRTVDDASLQPAVDAEIVRVLDGGRVEFAHPLFAAAVYAAAPRNQRQRLHRELASVSTDIEEQARHLSLASDGPDRELADLLDRASDHALLRGAPEIAADLAEQAARRTPDDVPDEKSDRLLRAGRHSLKAGDSIRARVLGEEVSDTASEGPIRARALYLRAQGGGMEGPAAAIGLLEQAIATVGDDVALGAELETALGWALLEVFELVAAEEHLVRAADLAVVAGDSNVLAQAIALRVVSNFRLGRGVDEAALERALTLEDPDREVPFARLPSLIVAQVLVATGRLDRARSVLATLQKRLVARGDEGDLVFVLTQLGVTASLAGHLEVAEEHASDALRIATLTGQEVMGSIALSIRAIVRASRGNVSGSRADGTEALARSERLAWPPGISVSRYALAFLALSEDDPVAAATWLKPVVAQVEALGVYEWVFAVSIPDAIEGLIATGDLTHATRLTDGLATLAQRHDRPWALALSGRCRALLWAATGDLDQAQASAEQALIEHERLPMPLELGRTLLVLGQLQRRRGERRAARETLKHAESTFEAIGARTWADKARAEARRIGVRRAPAELTANELLVARLAVDGLTNREIAALLFMSRRTVEANLGRAYGKLGIRSRTELASRMPRPESADSE